MVCNSGFSSYAGHMQSILVDFPVIQVTCSLYTATLHHYTGTTQPQNSSTKPQYSIKQPHYKITHQLHCCMTSVHSPLTLLHSHNTLTTYTGQVHNTTSSHLICTATPLSAYTDFFSQPFFTALCTCYDIIGGKGYCCTAFAQLLHSFCTAFAKPLHCF